jgi:hypothetical protein
MRIPARAATIAAVAAVFFACTPPRPALFPDIVPGEPPPPDSVDAILLMVGDAGEAIEGTAPLLARMKQEVEVWSELLARDSAVTVLFLGDNVYPAGVRDRGHPDFERDSAILWAQIDLVSGPNARQRGTVGFFLAGNHDWGNMSGVAGLARIKNMEEQIQFARQSGIPVQLAPPAGTSGPTVRDIRENVRVMMIDTHLYLQERAPYERLRFIASVENALREAGDRHVIIAAHHPYTSAGPHGDVVGPMTKALGVTYLLEKSGTLVQDLNSPIYRDLLTRLKQSFVRTRPPLVFAGGHDHSLQVHVGRSLEDPRYVLVSGAGSKSTDLVGADSMRFGTSNPGFMSLVFRKQGAVDLFVFAGRGTKTADECPPPAEDPNCVPVERDAFGVVYSERLAFVNPPPAASQPPRIDTIKTDTTSAVEGNLGGNP